MKFANDRLTGYTGTEGWHRYTGGVLITDGVKALATDFKCYWLLDVIASHQPMMRKKGIEYQYWRLDRKDGETNAVVSCFRLPTTDPRRLVLQQIIEYTDFELNAAIVWVKNDVMLLPSED